MNILDAAKAALLRLWMGNWKRKELLPEVFIGLKDGFLAWWMREQTTTLPAICFIKSR